MERPFRPAAPGILRPRAWTLPEREATPVEVFLDRRRFVAALGLGALAVAGGTPLAACGAEPPAGLDISAPPPEAPAPELYPAPAHPRFARDLPPVDRPPTEERVAARYNNFYEFSSEKDDVWKAVRRFEIRPWTVTVDGLVARPATFDVDELVRSLPLEERVYRFRCVEAWAMVVPWTGFPLRALLARVEPRSGARFVRFESFDRPSQAPARLLRPWLPWPYVEGLSLAEAANDLTFVATGVYGHPLPKQHGAPLRMVIPWKYGFKGAKSIVRITLTAEQPATFWNTIAPDEYGFVSNIEPDVPHPRWSQKSERMLGTNERRPTLRYGGYGEWVARLYGRAPRRQRRAQG